MNILLQIDKMWKASNKMSLTIPKEMALKYHSIFQILLILESFIFHNSSYKWDTYKI